MHEASEILIDSVSPHPRNAREGDVGAISESLKAFGQYRPIVVQAATPDGEARDIVLAGNHTWRAAKALGWKKVWAVRLTVDDATALRIMLADNRTHDLGTDRQGELSVLLAELAKDNLLTGTGWDGDDIDRLLFDVVRQDDMARAVADVPAPAPDRDRIGEAGLAYNIAFDDEDQQDRWYRFLKHLRETYPDGLTHAARLDAYLAEVGIE